MPNVKQPVSPVVGVCAHGHGAVRLYRADCHHHPPQPRYAPFPVRVALCAVDDDFYHRPGHPDCLLRLYGFLRRVHAGQLPQLLGFELRIEQNHPGRHGRSRTGIHFPRHGQRGYAGLLAVDGVPVHGYLPAAGLSGGADYGRPRNQARPDPRRAVHHPHVDELPPAHHCVDEPVGGQRAD